MLDESWLTEPSTAIKRLIFARHGQYTCNVQGVCNSDPRVGHPLTGLGQQQALALGERLRDEGVELIVCSEFLRARQTAWLANRALNVPLVVNRLANENRVGRALEGQPAPVFLDSIRHDPANSAAHDGESFNGLMGRVETLIHDLRLSSPTTILVVAHGWTLQAIRVLLGELPAEQAALNHGMPGNCAVLDTRF